MSQTVPNPAATNVPAPAVTPTSGPAFALTSMILGIFAVLLSFIPILNIGVWPMAALGVIFGGIALFRKHAARGMAIAGLVTSLVSIVVFFLMYASADTTSAL